MNQLPPTGAAPLYSIHQNLQTHTATLQPTDVLVETFGADLVGRASSQKFLGEFVQYLKDTINDSSLPDKIKDIAIGIIDEHFSDMGVVPTEVAEALDNSELGVEVEADVDAAKASADALLEALLAGTGKSAEEKKTEGGGGGGGSFLEALAMAMGKVQANLLNRAKIESDKMVDLSGNEEKADEFTTAQAAYSGIMQLFNIYSNQVATSLKTIGEATSAIARKQ